MAWGFAARWRADRAYFEGCRLARSGRPAEAVKAFDQVLETFPRHARAHLQRARALAAAGRCGEAVKAARRAAELDPRNHAPRLFQGQFHYDAGSCEEARKAFSAAQRLDPENRLVKAYLGLALLALGREQEGVELLRANLLYANEELEARLLALVEQRLWQQRERARPLEQQLSPEEGGREERAAGVWLRAASAVRRALLWPLARLRGRAAALMLEAEEAMTLGEWERAAAALREAQAAGADQESCALALGEAYLETGSAQAAAEQFGYLSEEVRRSPEVALLVGAALFETGRYEQARGPLETAARRFSREYGPCYYRGLCEIALGRPSASVEWFRLACERLNPHLAQKRLEELVRVRSAS